MKKIYLLISFTITFLNSSIAQSGQWVWLNGSDSINSNGSYGVQGVPSPNNNPPALYEPCEWTDLNGKFWMYGGLDDNSGIQIHNDLWKYDPVTNEWTWINGTKAINDTGNYGVQGVPAITNRPPSLGYGVTTWTDLNGNLWMFGGALSQTGPFSSDLWEYNISTNEWTWVNGPGTGNPTGIYGTQGIPGSSNYPASRAECASSWLDNSGDLCLFGGDAQGHFINDLWRYNISSNEWTWMTGSDTISQKGFWGVMGVENPANTPSPRRAYTHWKDNLGNFWMFGGEGLDSSGIISAYFLSDLWRYNPLTNNWTWMNGQNIGNISNIGIYTTKCIMSSVNQPSPRYENRAAWTDPNGNFWMFGGQFQPNAFASTTLNDLWMYCVSSNQWTWESGSNSSNSNPVGNWGTLGVSSPSNVPSARVGCPGWTDGKGHLYLFGGSSANFGDLYNDLWQFTIDSACSAGCSPLVTCSASFSIYADSTQLHHYIATNNASGVQPISCYWSWGDGTSDTIPYPSHIYANPGFYNICLSITDSTGCQNTFCDSAFHALRTTNTMVYVNVRNPLLTGTPVVSSESAQVCIYPNPASTQLTIQTPYHNLQKATLSIINTLGQQVLQSSIFNLQSSINISSLPAGIYFLQLTNESNRWTGKFIKE